MLLVGKDKFLLLKPKCGKFFFYIEAKQQYLEYTSPFGYKCNSVKKRKVQNERVFVSFTELSTHLNDRFFVDKN